MNNRQATITRTTGETTITLMLNIDGTGICEAHTGIGFLDHMLTLFAKHGLFDITANANGDLHVDGHHTAEDVCICLGQALDLALADRRGVVRTAHSFVPMDESLGFVAVDLGGRPYAVFDVEFVTPNVGTLGTDLIFHLFESIAKTITIRSKHSSKPLVGHSMLPPVSILVWVMLSQVPKGCYKKRWNAGLTAFHHF